MKTYCSVKSKLELSLGLPTCEVSEELSASIFRLCSVTVGYQRFGGHFCLHLQVM
jgi:hypothetical protein